jgi:hypothetical protein
VYTCHHFDNQFRDFSYYYERLHTEDPPLKDIVQSAAFDFTGKDIAKLRKNMGALLDSLSTLYLDTISKKKSTEPMSSAADPIVVTEPMSSAATDTLSTEPTLTTEPISSGADASVATDANTLPTEPVSSAPATTSLITDKSIVGAMREQFYRIFGAL